MPDVKFARVSGFESFSVMDISYKGLWKITLPIFSFLLIENIIAFMDTAFLGRVSERQLAAASIGGLYYVSVFIIGFGFSVGAQILISQRNGAGHFDKIGEIFATSLYGLIFLAALGFFSTHFFDAQIFSKMVSSPDILHDVCRFMKWRQWGFFAIFCVIAFRSFYVGIADTKVLAYSSWLMGIVNAALNYALVFGKFGFPRMEIEGSALASTISEFSGLALFAAYTFLKSDIKKYALKFGKVNPALCRQILGLSAWTMAQQFVYVAMWLFLFSFIEKFGQHELAQSNIFKSILMFVYMPMYAFGATMNTVAGNLFGEGRVAEIPKACLRAIKLEYALVVPALLLLVAIPFEVMSLYTDNPAILAGARIPFYCALFTVPFSIPAITTSNVILGLGRTEAAFFIEFSVLFLYIGGLFFTVHHMHSFGATWTLDGWYWIIVITLNLLYLKTAMPSRWAGCQ